MNHLYGKSTRVKRHDDEAKRLKFWRLLLGHHGNGRSMDPLFIWIVPEFGVWVIHGFLHFNLGCFDLNFSFIWRPTFNFEFGLEVKRFIKLIHLLGCLNWDRWILWYYFWSLLRKKLYEYSLEVNKKLYEKHGIRFYLRQGERVYVNWYRFVFLRMGVARSFEK